MTEITNDNNFAKDSKFFYKFMPERYINVQAIIHKKH